MSMSENSASTGIQSRTRIASAELAASMTSKPASRRLLAVIRRKSTSSSTISTTGAVDVCSGSMGSSRDATSYAFIANHIATERTLFILQLRITAQPLTASSADQQN